MIYKLLTENLPGNKVIGHALVHANGKEWSFAHICDSFDSASEYIENAISKWAKQELFKYANHRKQAYVHKGCFNASALAAYKNIIKITRAQTIYNTWYLVHLHQDSIMYLMPHRDSKHAGWLPILGEIIHYAQSKIDHLKQTA